MTIRCEWNSLSIILYGQIANACNKNHNLIKKGRGVLTMKYKMLVAVAMVGLFLIQPAWSASRYVETAYGDDAGPNNCKNRKKPCATITHALGQSGSDDKIIVGPGLYTPSGNFETIPGLKISSTAGAAGTIIDATDLSASNGVFYIDDDNKVAIGGKGKGFTIILDSGMGAAIYVENSSSVRIEGNRVLSLTEAVDNGINARSAPNLTLRYNTVYAGGAGSIGNGIDSGLSTSNKKWIVTNNTVINADQCMNIRSTAGNNGNRTADNRLDGCVIRGLAVVNYNVLFEPSVSSRDKHTGNVVRMMPDAGFQRAFSILGGSPALSKNLADLTAGNSDGIIIIDTTNASLKDNVVIGPPGGDGLYGIASTGSTTANLTVSGNTVSSVGTAVRHFTAPEIKELSNNNFPGNGCPIHFRANVARPKPLKASKNFWGDPAGPDLVNCGAFIVDAIADGHLKLSPSGKSNPIKFKDRFN